MQIGDVIAWERTFTEDDIRLFAELSGDKGTHHVTADDRGRIMAHGLLTATLPTKIGGDINFIAKEMVFQFHRPVFAGDTIRCEVTIENLEEAENYWNVVSTWICRNQRDKDVMTGRAGGVIRK